MEQKVDTELNSNAFTIAFLIQAYADTVAFKYLINTLLSINDCHVFVHLDKKSDIDEFLFGDERVHFIEQREFVSWAGYQQGKLIFNLIDTALQYPVKFDCYCFLSESDFPVFSGDKLVERLKGSQTILLNCTQHQKEKIERYWFYDFNIVSPKWNKVVSKNVNAASGLLYRLRVLKKKSQVLIDGKACDVFCSGPFWAYDYEQLTYINETFKRNLKFQNYFKHSFAPCELMLSTIIGNSKFASDCVFVDEYINLNHISGICYFKYTGSRVNVLDITDYQEIMKSGKPFIRKVNGSVSVSLIKRIKESW